MAASGLIDMILKGVTPVRVMMFLIAVNIAIFIWKIFQIFINGYGVFRIENERITILSGFPAAYSLDDIEEIVFSLKAAGSRPESGYYGSFRVVKKNGRVSRAYQFDSSSYYGRFTLTSSKEGIENTIRYLMEELSRYSISSRREG